VAVGGTCDPAKLSCCGTATCDPQTSKCKPPCIGPGAQGCGVPEDCCAGLDCQGDICCAPLNGGCNLDDDCCGGECDPLTDMCCAGLGGSCGEDGDCCGGTCNPTRRTCGSPARIYVANASTSSVTVFDARQSGNVAPLQEISGPSTGLDVATSAIPHGGELFVVNHIGGTVRVFRQCADGDVPPLRSIEGGNTGFSYPVRAFVSGAELFVTNVGAGTSVWDIAASGDVPPQRTLDLWSSYGLLVVGDALLLTRHPWSGDQDSVHALPASASGSPEPLWTLVGEDTQLHQAGGLAVVGGELFVSNDASNAVTVYDYPPDLDAAPNAAPRRVIQGEQTGLNGPIDPAVFGDEIFVANRNNDTITVHGARDEGNVPPGRILGGDATRIHGPMGIFVE